MTELVQIRGLAKSYPVRRGVMQRQEGEARVLDGVDLDLFEGECLAVVGESGSGKSTLGRCMLALLEPSAGQVFFSGEDLQLLPGSALRRKRRDFQMIFQDPASSLNPRMKVESLISEPLEIHQIVPPEERRARVFELLQMVEVPKGVATSYPHELSGGQRQRIAIARALATEPRLLVADEPVSALDVSLQGQIINLLADLRDRLNLTMLLISHDLAVVEHIADRVAVMYAGRIVELATTESIFSGPQHPYTVGLLSAVPTPEIPTTRKRISISGEPPDPRELPLGCRFHPRCPSVRGSCREHPPLLGECGTDHSVACYFPGELVWPASEEDFDGTF